MKKKNVSARWSIDPRGKIHRYRWVARWLQESSCYGHVSEHRGGVGTTAGGTGVEETPRGSREASPARSSGEETIPNEPWSPSVGLWRPIPDIEAGSSGATPHYLTHLICRSILFSYFFLLPRKLTDEHHFATGRLLPKKRLTTFKGRRKMAENKLLWAFSRDKLQPPRSHPCEQKERQQKRLGRGRLRRSRPKRRRMRTMRTKTIRRCRRLSQGGRVPRTRRRWGEGGSGSNGIQTMPTPCWQPRLQRVAANRPWSLQFRLPLVFNAQRGYICRVLIECAVRS